MMQPCYSPPNDAATCYSPPNDAATCYSPPNDAAPAPHECDASVVESPVELVGCLPQQHEALCVRDDLARVQRLNGQNYALGKGIIIIESYY